MHGRWLAGPIVHAPSCAVAASVRRMAPVRHGGEIVQHGDLPPHARILTFPARSGPRLLPDNQGAGPRSVWGQVLSNARSHCLMRPPATRELRPIGGHRVHIEEAPSTAPGHLSMALVASAQAVPAGAA